MANSNRFVSRHGLDNNNNTIQNVADPVNAQDAATKAFSSNAANLASGTVPAARMPAFTGDATVASGTTTITLTNSGATAGTYKSVTVDAKGRVTAGTNPTTLSGYGITDAAPSSHVGASGAAHGAATTSVAGFMSSTDKTKLDGISASTVVGTELGTAAVGASTSYARADHVHPAQTTVSGNAGTATTLQTARNLTIGSTAKSFNGSANVDWSLAEIGAAATSHSHSSFANAVTFGAATQQTRNALAGSTINLALADFFTYTIATATTFSVTNVPVSGTTTSFILDLTNGGSSSITWWTGVKWAGGTAPVLTTAGRDVLGFFTHDGGNTWTGLVLGKDVK